MYIFELLILSIHGRWLGTSVGAQSIRDICAGIGPGVKNVVTRWQGASQKRIQRSNGRDLLG